MTQAYIQQSVKECHIPGCHFSSKGPWQQIPDLELLLQQESVVSSLAKKRMERVYSKKQGVTQQLFFSLLFLSGTLQTPHALPSCRLYSLGALFSTVALIAAWWGSTRTAFVIIFDSKGHPKSKVKYFPT